MDLPETPTLNGIHYDPCMTVQQDATAQFATMYSALTQSGTFLVHIY